MDGLLYGLEVALSPGNLGAAFVGVLFGTLIGVLPGLGPTAGAAILLPLTFAMDPVAGLIMIAGIYYGTIYGASTTSVLLNIPGDSSAIVTTFDGHKMTKNGRAGPALTIITVGSFLTGTVATLLITFFGPGMSAIAIEFGPGEFLAIVIAGLVFLARVMGGRLLDGLLPLALGLMVATIGFDPAGGTSRFTLGSSTLNQGISVVAVAVGAFGVGEVMRNVLYLNPNERVERIRLKDLIPTKTDWRRALAPWFRGGVLGFVLGLLPGAAPTVSTFMSYRLEKAVSKHRQEIGTGAIEGVAGPEAANNSAATSGIIPLLSLGIPFTVPLALMLAAMMVQGIVPGPLLVDQRPDIFWGVIASMYIGNIMLVILNLPMIGVWVRLLQVPPGILMASIAGLAVAGIFAVNNSIFDVWVLVGSGILGFAFSKIGLHLAPFAIGLILGPFVEKYFREGVIISNGDILYLFDSAIALSIYAIVLVYLTYPLWSRVFRRRKRSSKSRNTLRYEKK